MSNNLDLVLAQKIVDMLNDLLVHDKPAVAALIANRVPCSKYLADHPTIQVAGQHGGHHVGLLGLLNGLCGIDDQYRGPITAIFDEDKNPQGYKSLSHFEVWENGKPVDQPPTKPELNTNISTIEGK